MIVLKIHNNVLCIQYIPKISFGINLGYSMLDIWGARKIGHRNTYHLLVIGELLTVANKI